jgi:hypothetical protein
MYFNISLHNIFNKKNKFESYFCYYISISKNKNIETQLIYTNSTFFKIELDFSLIGKDHAGIYFEINVLGYELCLKMYDSRHWNYENWCWEK